ncbi:MAG: FKBP-type peptidyl-prolyl cis-trans isomerase [Patescibacteria group bacterium UBA2163]
MSIQKNTSIAIILALIVVAIFIGLGFFVFPGSNTDAENRGNAQALLDELQQTGTVTELKMQNIVSGNGEEAEAGDVVVVHYTGVLPDGTVFDSSHNRGEPFIFELGAGQVIEGWERGVSGMQVGGRRLLVIPPELGYGATAVGPIPANATLIFDVELLQILSSEAREQQAEVNLESQ